MRCKKQNAIYNVRWTIMYEGCKRFNYSCGKMSKAYLPAVTCCQLNLFPEAFIHTPIVITEPEIEWCASDILAINCIFR